MKHPHEEDAILDSLLELHLEEHSGRNQAPDRLQEILARARSGTPRDAAPEPQAARGSRLLAAALVIAAVGVTTLVFLQRHDPDTSEGDSSAVASQVAQDPEKRQQDKPQQDKPQQDPKKKGNTKQDPKKDNAKDPKKEGATGLMGRMLEAQRNQEKKAAVQAAKAAELEALVNRLQAVQGRAVKLNLVGGGNPFRRTPALPKLGGKTGTAIRDLKQSTDKLYQAKDLDAAKQLADQLEQQLGQLRRAIWEAQKAGVDPLRKDTPAEPARGRFRLRK